MLCQCLKVSPVFHFPTLWVSLVALLFMVSIEVCQHAASTMEFDGVEEVA